MHSAAVFQRFGAAGGAQAAFFQNPAAGGVAFKKCCRHFFESHAAQVVDYGTDGLCCVAVALIGWVKDVADFNGVRFNTAVSDKTDQLALQVNAVLQVLGIADLAELDKLLRQADGLRFRSEIRNQKCFGVCPVSQQVGQCGDICRRVGGAK